MIEGLIIVGVAAVIIVVALFGTSLYASATAAIASVSAMVTSAITGTANLLTAWWYWAIATDITSYYVGWFWLATWLSLFAYSSFKIATSDKKKWMNLVGRGSNYLGVVLILFLVAQPLAVSWGVTYLADTTTYAALDYNVNTQVTSSGAFVTSGVNATDTYWETLTPIFDNSTKETIVVALDFDDVTSPTSYAIDLKFNSSILVDSMITKISITYLYVGTGNITQVRILDGTSPFGVMKDFLTTIVYSGNDTLSWIPEAFKSNQLKTKTLLNFVFTFGDTTDFPSDGDYMSIAINFYTTSTVMSQATIMMWFAAIMAIVDLIGLLYASGAMQKYIL